MPLTSVVQHLPQLHFCIDVRSPERRRANVTLEVDCSDPGPRSPTGSTEDRSVEFFLPTWTPGSYLIREFSRHLGPVWAVDALSEERLACSKSYKNRYRVTMGRSTTRVRLTYEVYAHELSVRTADITPEHAYWNHACMLLWPVQRPELEARLDILTPTGWDCVGGTSIAREGPGRFTGRLAGLDAGADSPVLCGTFVRLQRDILGKRHVVALDGLGAARVHARFLDHVARIVEEAAAVFGGRLPYQDFTFLSLFTDSGHGGLEHRDSTTLLAARTAMWRGKPYLEFLGLLAHELFHAWNVKRMRPVEFWQYDYEVENYTSMLWLAEGWTAYYDDLICRRARLLSAEDYLALIAKNLGNLWSSMGRFRQSLSEASFDAWIRHYRPDENTRNSTQNYYGNGALAALILDLTIRRTSNGSRSLDDALARLWDTTYECDRGYRFDDVARAVSEAAGRDLRSLLVSLTQAPLDPDFETLLADFGISIQHLDRDRPYLGFSLEAGCMIVATVADDSPAFTSGLAPGDEILAIDGLRVISERWNDVFASIASVGSPMQILTSSRGLIRERTVVPAATPRSSVRLLLETDIGVEKARLRDGWLGADAAANLDAEADAASR